MDLMSDGSDPRNGWIPFRIDWRAPTPEVQWCRIGARRFVAPFFEETLASVMAEPFALAFRRVTPIDDLTGPDVEAAAARPTGFIFHMSRCGSTLVAQTLASLPGNVVLSEAGPIEAVLRAPERIPGLDDGRHLAWLRGMILALGRRRNPGESRLFVKFDCWHTQAIPLIRRAFPDVPWIFVYREPVEVIVSHLRTVAIQMMPGIRPPAWFKLDLAEALAMPREEYIARVLAAICGSAVEHSELGAGLFVSYRELPEASWLAISEHFGVRWSLDEVAVMKEAAQRDTKNPGQPFRDDTSAKQSSADDEVRRLADAWLTPLYHRMDAIRPTAQSSRSLPS
jgi:hypothetical protein